MTYTLRYDANKCIGVGQCAALSPLWTMNNKGKAVLKGAVEVKPGVFELQLSESDAKRQKQVVSCCPVQAITLLKNDA